MADPFEVRMRFTSQLQGLNASVNSAQKAAQYALRYKEMDEDLHSCILEQVERVCFLSPAGQNLVLTIA
jgi:CTD kinase subunit gamma